MTTGRYGTCHPAPSPDKNGAYYSTVLFPRQRLTSHLPAQLHISLMILNDLSRANSVSPPLFVIDAPSVSANRAATYRLVSQLVFGRET